jgi:hypothetical protein
MIGHGLVDVRDVHLVLVQHHERASMRREREPSTYWKVRTIRRCSTSTSTSSAALVCREPLAVGRSGRTRHCDRAYPSVRARYDSAAPTGLGFEPSFLAVALQRADSTA